MTDAQGSTSYIYDSLSRMTSETRTFNGLGSYNLSYDYNLAGELKKITDPTGATINYGFDSIGQLSGVAGSDNLYAGVSNYASGFTYRATGAIKGLTYGNNMTMSVAYNSRLQATQLEIGGRNPQYGPPTAASTQFSYYEDGSLRYAHDLIDERFDRAFAHDNVAMVKEAYSGSESRDFINGTSSPTATGPYRQSYQHDAFGNMTRRDNRFWSAQDTFIASYANNRRVDAGFQYDADGNLTHDTDLAYSYDAAGRNVSITSLANQRTISSLDDGDGQPIKRTVTQFGNTSFTYYVRSSVLGGRVISELNAQGQKQTGYVFAGNSVLAKQENNIVIWKHQNPITGSQGDSTAQGAYFPKAEFDPMGVDVGFGDPYLNCCGGGPTGPEFPMLIGGGADDFGRCTLDGMAIDCGWAMELMGTGAAVQCPNNDCGPRWNQNLNNRQGGFDFFRAYADGFSGFVPMDGRASQNGPSNVPALSAPTPVSPIRAVDFDHISYPNFPDYSDPNGRKKKYVTLKPGEGGPNFINYGDITGDRIEEAMVALGIDNHGSAIPDYVYIFAIENGRPKIIWDFETADRADGGLRNVYADNGQLVIELFGKDRVIGGQLYRGEEGLCCPDSFTRTRYKWTGKHFEVISKEVLANPSRDANPVMPQYEAKK